MIRPVIRLLISFALFGLSFCLIAPLVGRAADVGDGEPAPDVPPRLPAEVISPTSFFVLYGREDASGENGAIWLLDDLGNREIISDSWQPVLSPSGRYLAYVVEEASDWLIYVRDLISMTDTLVFTVTSFTETYAWTPDGERLVLDHSCGIYSVDRDGGDQQTLVHGWPDEALGCYNDAPHVNPVDGRLVWVNWEHSPGLAVSGPQGQHPYWLTNTLQNDVYPIWSPDGAWIAFSRNWYDVYKIRPDGSDLTRLTYLDGWLMGGGAWSPDGEWILWSAWVGDAADVYAVATDGSGLMVPMGTMPGWVPDWVGGAGLMTIDVRDVFLPLVMRSAQ
jgi:hypothetical protein